MATIKTSALVADIKGKVGGNAFARNKSGIYVRSHTKALNPRTASQQLARARVSTASHAWLDLTAQQREDWAAFAVNSLENNRLGDQINIGGQASFVKLYVLSSQAGLTVPTSAPLRYGHAPGLVVSFTATASTQLFVGFSASPSWDYNIDDSALLIFQSMASPASRSAEVKNWKFMVAELGADGIPFAFVSSPYSSVFSFKVGDRVGLAFVTIDQYQRVSQRTNFYEIGT